MSKHAFLLGFILGAVTVLCVVGFVLAFLEQTDSNPIDHQKD
jgi:hypothetical protein